MKIEVRYYSRSGNTQKLAEAIAEQAGCTARDLSVPVDGHIDLLFLGASVYAGGIDKKVMEFIPLLNKDTVGSVAVFSTSALAERAYPQIKKELEKKGVTVLDKNFYCRGKFMLFHRGRPNDNDIVEVKSFASNLISVANNQSE
ncbi:MAG: flavodoxin [Clostridiales bacterium]|nr:flavodoxin [Clostridiales bacterium]